MSLVVIDVAICANSNICVQKHWVPKSCAPFREAAELLYNGPWVAERLASVKGVFGTNATAFDPTVRSIISGATQSSSVDAFEGFTGWKRFARRHWLSGKKPMC
ncbi:Allophanate hydrolase [Agrobacterium sp. DSM 25558]|uniref:Allophanate hydrolase n=1 Tax=Agrobacterium rosae TaxID=1972867 RepID=A0A1R3TLY4_9HYPH|nr:Allophanate hydrolase [Agrobacterium sp. DSM 25558]SCX23031.1 Allophanate hydrolase [Agrobacterium rosae]